MGTKRSVLTDENGLPLAVVLSGANTHDVKLLEDITFEEKARKKGGSVVK